VTFHGNDRQLEYDITVSPGASARVIRFDIPSARTLTVDPSGDLIVESAAGPLRQRRPIAYQTIGQQRREIPASFRVRGHELGFNVGRYDRTRPLVIDPVLVYDTTFGGSRTDRGKAIAVDQQNNAYIFGETNSVDFPAVHGFANTAATAPLWVSTDNGLSFA